MTTFGAPISVQLKVAAGQNFFGGIFDRVALTFQPFGHKNTATRGKAIDDHGAKCGSPVLICC